jgi:hypothetical protein
VAPSPAHAAEISIQTVQLTTLENTVVYCGGVVVTGAGMFGYFVQEPDPDPTWVWKYSGIWVYAPGHTMHKGDLVNVSGLYKEYYGQSEIDIPAAGGEGFQTLTGPGTIPDPVQVPINTVNDGGVDNEAYEGVFIRVDSSSPPPDSLNSLREYYLSTANKYYWAIQNPSGDSLSVMHENSKAGDDFEYGAPNPDTRFGHLQGILEYNRDRYRLAPRSCEEDFGAPCVPMLRGAYATGPTSVNVQFDVDLDQATAEVEANYELLSGANVTFAELDPVRLNTVHLTIGTPAPAFPLNAEQVMVSGVRSTGGLLMSPNQSKLFRSGITTIYDVQWVTDPAVRDSSVLVGAVVTLEARVTAIQGGYYYLQEGDAGQWKGLYCRVAKSGNIALGDRLQVSGEVTEYYGMTELVYKTGVDNFQNLGTDPTAVTVKALTTADLRYRDAARTAERWESSLVKLINATFRDSIPGTAGPYYKEWLLAQGALPDTAMVDMDGMNLAGGSYDACKGNRATITGVLSYSYDKYRVFPRTGRGGDIIELEAAEGCPVTDVDPVSQSAALDLRQNRPNPFGVETSIGFALPAASRVRLEVIDVSGRLVRVLAAGPLGSGEHIYQWNGMTDAGRHAAAGTYFYRLRCDGRETSRRLVLLP